MQSSGLTKMKDFRGFCLPTPPPPHFAGRIASPYFHWSHWGCQIPVPQLKTTYSHTEGMWPRLSQSQHLTPTAKVNGGEWIIQVSPIRPFSEFVIHVKRHVGVGAGVSSSNSLKICTQGVVWWKQSGKRIQVCDTNPEAGLGREGALSPRTWFWSLWGW